MTTNIGAELDELIRTAQQRPGVAEIMAFYAQYSELLKNNSECSTAMAPQGISSYSSNST